MQKKIVLTLTFILSACSSDNSTQTKSSVPAVRYYEYGTTPLPGSSSSIDGNYKPKHLHEKSFSKEGARYFPLQFVSQNLSFTFDLVTQKAMAHSKIEFHQTNAGIPYFFLSPVVETATLNGSALTIQSMPAPFVTGENYQVLSTSVPVGVHQLELTYTLPSSAYSFKNGGIAFLTDMTDLRNAHFFETWGPSGFEDDAFKLELQISVLNATGSHTLFTNGTPITPQSNRWIISFPDHFSTSSFFVHLTTSTYARNDFIIDGLTKKIPVTVYSSDPQLVQQASLQLPLLFREFENDFGPYAHDRFTAYLHSGGGGMEYTGATITSLGALDHELFHSWFARGVRPAEGRSGWIDEAFASWRDNSYFQSSSLLSREPTALATYAPFSRSTPPNSYRDGRRLIAELDQVLATFGGMKLFMKLLFEKYQQKPITTEEFFHFLTEMSHVNLDAYFKRYTLAEVTTDENQPSEGIKTDESDHSDRISKHPRPLTKKEAENLR